MFHNSWTWASLWGCTSCLPCYSGKQTVFKPCYYYGPGHQATNKPAGWVHVPYARGQGVPAWRRAARFPRAPSNRHTGTSLAWITVLQCVFTVFSIQASLTLVLESYANCMCKITNNPNYQEKSAKSNISVHELIHFIYTVISVECHQRLQAWTDWKRALQSIKVLSVAHKFRILFMFMQSSV